VDIVSTSSADSGLGCFVRGAALHHVNVGIFGDVGHGASTLAEALSEVADGRRGRRSEVPARSQESVTGRSEVHEYTIGPLRYVECRTRTRRYVFVDMPGSAVNTDVVVAAAQLDVLILVVSACDGVTARTAELLILARHAGVPRVLVAMTKVDAADPELTDVVALEAADLLAHDGRVRGGALPTDGHRTGAVHPPHTAVGAQEPPTVTPVSALGALHGAPGGTDSVCRLLGILDALVPSRVRTLAPPFLLPLQRVAAIDPTDADAGVAATGVIRRGRVRVGQTVDPERLGWLRVVSPWSGCRVTGIESLGRPVREAGAGDPVTLFLHAGLHELRHAPVLAAHYTFAWRRRFTAWIQLHTTSANPLAVAVFTGSTPLIDFGATINLGAIDLGATECVRPGEAAAARIELRNGGLPLAPGLGFALRYDTGVIGTGTILAVAPGQPAHHDMPADW
jgi:elongation factor Tu